jgi:hypothetical protein
MYCSGFRLVFRHRARHTSSLPRAAALPSCETQRGQCTEFWHSGMCRTSAAAPYALRPPLPASPPAEAPSPRGTPGTGWAVDRLADDAQASAGADRHWCGEHIWGTWESRRAVPLDTAAGPASKRRPCLATGRGRDKHDVLARRSFWRASLWPARGSTSTSSGARSCQGRVQWRGAARDSVDFVDLEITIVTHDLTSWRNTSDSSSVLLINEKLSLGFESPCPFVDPLGRENLCQAFQVVGCGR